MPKKKITVNKTVIAAIILLAVLVIAAGAVIYLTEFSPKPSAAINVGVKVGDTFTYKLMGESLDATTPAYLSDYNNTESYKVVVAAISGTVVSVEIEWAFINGTIIPIPGSVNIATGAYTGPFWSIYPSNLNLNNLLNPNGQDELIVNSTGPRTYTAATRQTNYWSTNNIFADPSDPTNSTQCVNYVGVYFDKQTGMLVSLTNQQEFLTINPDETTSQYSIITYMQLISSTVWNV